MDHDEARALFDRQMRRSTRPEGVERVGDVVRQVGVGGDWSGILWSDLDPATADEAIAEQVRYFAGLGRAFEWKLYSYDRPDDLGARLSAAGFVPEPMETLMVAEVASLPTDVELPQGVELRTATDAAGLDLMAEVHQDAFGASSARLREQLVAQLERTPHLLEVVVATAGSTPVSSARIELYPGADFASLWGGGTVEAWRGRGVYRALVAHRARIAAEQGVRYLQVDASDQSRPILQRLGFAPLSTTTPYVYEP
ncbi:GNAT family N-acetyltransferase [Streptomyces sp. NPDC051907]|uniref:GNAT family N-acetyltransferase n=1 Tax=Streptomyces sp. NPDC051907 TaxID=3155284 RepID=UPI00341CE065